MQAAENSAAEDALLDDGREENGHCDDDAAVGAEHGAYGLLVEVVGVYVQLLERIRRYHAERDIRYPAEREARQAPARRVNKPVEAAAQELAQKQRDKQQAQRIVDKIHLRRAQKVGLCRHQQAQRDREHRHVEHQKYHRAPKLGFFFRLSRISPSLSAEAR